MQNIKGYQCNNLIISIRNQKKVLPLPPLYATAGEKKSGSRMLRLIKKTIKSYQSWI
jgi:hypothetical protein